MVKGVMAYAANGTHFRRLAVSRHMAGLKAQITYASVYAEFPSVRAGQAFEDVTRWDAMLASTSFTTSGRRCRRGGTLFFLYKNVIF